VGVFAGEVGDEVVEVFVGTVFGEGAVLVVGAGGADAVAVVADVHKLTELVDLAGFKEVDADGASGYFGCAEEEDAADVVAGGF